MLGRLNASITSASIPSICWLRSGYYWAWFPRFQPGMGPGLHWIPMQPKRLCHAHAHHAGESHAHIHRPRVPHRQGAQMMSDKNKTYVNYVWWELVIDPGAKCGMLVIRHASDQWWSIPCMVIMHVCMCSSLAAPTCIRSFSLILIKGDIGRYLGGYFSYGLMWWMRTSRKVRFSWAQWAGRKRLCAWWKQVASGREASGRFSLGL